MVLRLHINPALDHRLHHVVAQVHQLIGGRAGKIALLVTQLGSQIRLLIAAPVPLRLAAVEMEIALVCVLVEAHIVEHEKLRLGADEAGVGDAGALEIVGRFAGHMAGIAGVVFAADRILHVADHRQRRQHRKRIDHRRRRHRNQQHVALVDRLPAADARSVEAEAILKDILLQFADGNRVVLPRT